MQIAMHAESRTGRVGRLPYSTEILEYGEMLALCGSFVHMIKLVTSKPDAELGVGDLSYSII
jgi:hypothetical protein